MLIVLSGPPCSGKSTAAKELGLPVIDWDEIYSTLSRLPLHVRSQDGEPKRLTEQSFRQAMDQASRAGQGCVVIRCAPERWLRGFFRRQYHAIVVVLEVPADECLRRLEGTDRPPDAKAAAVRGIREWWKHYEPSPHDIVARNLGPGGVVESLHHLKCGTQSLPHVQRHKTHATDQA